MLRRHDWSGRTFPLDIGIWALRTASHDKERDWLNNAWQKVTNSVKADDDVKKAKLAIKAIAVALIYLDFCVLGWEEEVSWEYSDWAKELGLTPQILKQLAVLTPEVTEEIEEDFGLYEELILKLANDSREEVFDILCPVFNNYPELIEELAAINDYHSSSDVSDRVCSWFHEKCYYIIPYN
jgi:hypothetical protein